jgi:23S rRNA (cytidine1920-2'-O)/16S rRNA (cytidine1409-2'-O)-methyltransferase
MASKIRLDKLLVQKGLAESRQKGQAIIMAGKVLVNEQPVDKPGVQVSEDASVAVKGEPLKYVSRGGLKLEAAIIANRLNIDNKICLDVGASTGGFTDCLLQHGAAHVYAVDVGYGQLAWKLRQDPRVTVIERTNIRYMPDDCIGAPVDLATVDVSFISLKIVIPRVKRLVKDQGRIIALIKPQFEVGKGQVGKGGVVRDHCLRQEVIDDLTDYFAQLGLGCGSAIPSPILGPKGNQEFITVLTLSNFGL